MRLGPLRELARLLSIQTTYDDAAGKKRNASRDKLVAAIEMRLPEGVGMVEALGERRRILREQLVEPVTVVWGRRIPRISLRLTHAEVEADLEWGTGEQSGRIALRDLPVVWSDDESVGKTISLPQRLPHGYHVVQLKVGTRIAETFVIAAPMRAPAPDDARDWGLFLPLYAARTHRSWGAGDLTDLRAWREWTHELGGGIVATLPLLAQFDDEPSPYSPVSRLFWNEMYLDPARLPEFRDSDIDPAQLVALEQSHAVDYENLHRVKRGVLERMAKRFVRDQEFHAWARQGAHGYAHFRAAKEERESADYHLYVQYRMAQQMRELGEGLYLDFPVGVHADGFDTWKYAKQFAKGVSVGAPPDSFFTKGQNWGFPPLDPDRIRDHRHDYFRAAIRHHVAHASVLRLDHVMGLHRLYWIPEGAEATDGVYVRYPAEELYAIATLEASLHDCVIVGEDLGTVPPYVPRAMKTHGLRRMHVVQYESDLGAPDAQSVASVNTHDMPSFAGWWSGKDIEDRIEQKLLDHASAAGEWKKRDAIRHSRMSFLAERGLLLSESGDTKAVLEAILRFLAGTEAEIVLVNVEDLWLEPEPQNVPGVPQRSWRRKFRYALDDIRANRDVVRILQAVNEARRGMDGSQEEEGRDGRGREAAAKEGEREEG